MKKYIITFLAFFLVSCQSIEQKNIENPMMEIEKIENISKNTKEELQESEKNSDIERRISDKNITISLSSYAGPMEWKYESSSIEKGYIHDTFSVQNTVDFYENRNNFPDKNATIYALYLDDYRYDMAEMYTKEQMILVFEILALYKNLDKNFEINIGNSDYIADKEFLSALADLPVENLTLNGQKMFQ